MKLSLAFLAVAASKKLPEGMQLTTADCPVTCELIEDSGIAGWSRARYSHETLKKISHPGFKIRVTHTHKEYQNANLGSLDPIQHRCYRKETSCVCECLEPKPLWNLAINVNPSDGHSMGYGSTDWFGNVNLGSDATALSKDYVSTAAYATESKYVAIVRHSEGSSACEAVKVFKWADQTKTFKSHFATKSSGMGATPAATLESEYVPADLTDKSKDPIFGNSGDLQVNYWYSNNGVRMCLTGAYGYPTEGNTDDIHGLGNEFGASTSTFGGSSSYEHDVAQRYNQDCHGASCPLMGTDVGSSLNPSSISYQYAVYTSDSETTFACEGKTLY